MNRDLDPISGRAIGVAIEIGLLGLLTKQPQSLEALAAGTACAPRGLRPLLYLLTSVDLIRQKGDGFLLAPGALRYVQRKWAREFAAFPVIPQYEHLERAVRTGRPVRPAVEGDSDDGAFFAAMTPGMFDLHWPDADHLAQAIPSGVTTVLDLGAGSGVWSLALAKRRPEVKVVAVDRARVLQEVTESFLRQHGLRDQYQLRPGDYHKVPLEDDAFDVVLLGHLLHADGWELSRKLLARTYKALKPGGYLGIGEFVASIPRSRDYASNVFDLSMLMLTDQGVVFDAKELESLVADYSELQWLKGPGDYPTLLARKAT